MPQLFRNNFETQFIAPVKSAPQTGTPASELGWGVLQISDGAAGVLSNPTGGDYYILTALKRSGANETNIEIMRVTAVDNGTPNECRITVNRAQEGSTAQAYVAGDRIGMRLTRGGVENFVQAFALTSKQDILVSGQNIKTVNGQTLLGSGDVSISADVPWATHAGTTPTLTIGAVNKCTNAASITAQLPAVADGKELYVYFVNPLTTHRINGHIEGDASASLIANEGQRLVVFRGDGSTWRAY